MGKTGYSLIELLFVMSATVTAGGIAIQPLLRALDDYRTAGAVRYISTRIQRTRMEAVTRSTNVAMQFVQAGTGFSYRTFIDGNGDGVRTQDIKNGIDYPLGPSERIPDNFSEVDFSLLPGLPAVEPGTPPPGTDPIKLGSSNLLSYSPTGTSSSGILGDTGRTRILRFDAPSGQWAAQ